MDVGGISAGSSKRFGWGCFHFQENIQKGDTHGNLKTLFAYSHPHVVDVDDTITIISLCSSNERLVS
jgi:hypothetical protein